MRSKTMYMICALLLCLGLLIAPTITAAQQKVSPQTKSAVTDKINLNTATLEQLQALPGIGPAMAKRIVEYRAKAGKFTKIEELINVRGIGEKAFVKMKDRLTV